MIVEEYGKYFLCDLKIKEYWLYVVEFFGGRLVWLWRRLDELENDLFKVRYEGKLRDKNV